jgi:cation:H+ antiporter
VIENAPLPVILGIFALATAAVAICGVMMTGLADRIADRTGLGEAVVGGVLLGMATSLSGSVVSVVSALDGRAALAFANGVGGIAAQTAFLAVADVIHRRANLEHAAAELANLLQASLLSLMLSLPLLAVVGPEVSILGVHPVSLLLPVAYVFGVRAASRVRAAPLWHPVATRHTRHDEPDEAPAGARAALPLALRFVLLAVVLSAAGWAISRSGGALADRAGISETAVGALMTAVATSLPELVTTLAAVRRGALQLAVGGIIGGNTFDVLFLTASDVAYRDGSLYHAVGDGAIYWLAAGMAMTALLLLGLIVREREGPLNIGFESVGILAIYFAAIAGQVALG